MPTYKKYIFRVYGETYKIMAIFSFMLYFFLFILHTHKQNTTKVACVVVNYRVQYAPV